ncbi:Pumilio homolog 5 [Zea mays]|uniref:Pumilio homolog 5 n=1 Tax=Zea mays TaxID=4577 RepID=A0A1D6PY10_MAIZE|nr:Pumilio homolog 5 [Zea mays]
MATESAVRLIGGTGARDWSKGFGAFDSSVGALSGEDLGFVDNDAGVYGGWSKSVPNRSGSAPPSMEGSLAALGHLIGQQSGSFEASLATLDNITDSSKSEEQVLADPAYFEYYGSKVNLNPRLPPPLISRESRRLMNRVGKAKEWRVVSQDNSNKDSIYIPRSTLSTHKEEPEDDKSPRLDLSSVEDAQIISSASNFQSQDFMLESFRQSAASLPNSSSSNPSNINTGDSMPVYSDINLSVDAVKQSDLNSWTPKRPLKSTVSNDVSSLPLSSSSSYSGRKPGMQTSQQEKAAVDTKHGNVVLGSGAAVSELDNVDSSMNNLMISLDGHASSPVKQKWQDNVLWQYGSFLPAQGDPTQGIHLPHVPSIDNLSHAQLKLPAGDMHQFLPQPSMTTPFYTPNSFGNPYYPNLHPGNAFPTSIGTGGYAVSGSILPPFVAGFAPQGPLATPLDSPMTPSFSGRPSGFSPAGNLTGGTEFMQSYKVYGQPGAARRGGTVPNYQGISSYVGGPMTYPTSPVFQGQTLPGVLPPDRRNDPVGFQSPSRNITDSPGIQRQRDRQKFDESKTCSFLEELKSNRARRVELSDITGRIIEYSADQHGSRFIQQKLENCTAEEKAYVFAEVLPHASSLMTDVFGNYVIQKFFEHGTREQRRDLATKLVGHVLPLSLQMYGCRVIQKALEVMELDQKIDLVHELDGHVMRCVRDQNGNHVIQKCIECVPTEHIGFVVSAFQGQVASLSMHPYGCRVIQRVLEHCGGTSQSQCIVDEILQSACVLAQDQYGNYVTQHVLERGNAHERSQIIIKLAGQVVTMSQNKFASNVIEKCFQHGDMAERDLLIRQIVEQTEGNDNLLAMMKDQYANYVVQKILETCNENQRELLVSRVKGHMQALRKYTYGKHIVSRVEQLCGDGTAEPDS